MSLYGVVAEAGAILRPVLMHVVLYEYEQEDYSFKPM